jgi:AraC family transcriptional regulator
MTDYTARIQAIIDYIEEHLSQELTLVGLAKRACFSEYHFHRVFLAYVGESVMEYIRKRRLTEAAHALAHTDQRIVDIAFDHGFQSHETFSRAFKRCFSMTPGEYRKHPSQPIAFLKANLIHPYPNGGIAMEPKFVTKPEFMLIGFELRTTTIDGRNHKEIPAFWQQYIKEDLGSRIPNKLKPTEELGICGDFHPADSSFGYVIGFEVDRFEGAGEDMVCKAYPAAQYVVFTTPPASEDQFAQSIQSTWKAIYKEWFPQSGYEHAGTPEFELYDERSMGSENKQMDIYIPIKKA